MENFYRFKITGVVQGVGFRPFIYREATKRGLLGSVRNTGEGVEIVVNDKAAMLEILKKLPPLAKVEKLEVETLTTPPNNVRNNTFLKSNTSLDKPPFINTELSSQGEESQSVGAMPCACPSDKFEIQFSENKAGDKYAQVPPDIATCSDCVTELLDPQDRRHGYFFISCTNCGPRYSIAKKVPFDRANTALKDFPLCPDCAGEYTDPSDRRFHAQTIACVKCGPQLALFKARKKLDVDPLKKTMELLQAGAIISIKGIGGFSLVCKADKTTTKKLRALVKRPQKPFALMVKDLKMAEAFCDINKKEKKVLPSSKRPIVLCLKKKLYNFETLGLSNSLSPNNRLGIMLPYTGLHHLLFTEIKEPLIVTSANLSGVPIPIKREEQDWEYILDYDREIYNFSDDSIVKVIDDNPLLIRRSRGYIPTRIDIPSNFQNFEGDILSVGAGMKNTFSIKKGEHILTSPHLGNTEKLENFANFKATLDRFLALTKADPKVILCDGNPNFQTAVFAREYAQKNKIKCVPVQHHIAHVYSVALEHNLKEFIGIAADGTGWGSDGKVWGGEVFFIDKAESYKVSALQSGKKELKNISDNSKLETENGKRIGHLEYQKLVGGDRANQEPVRFLVGILEKFLDLEQIEEHLCHSREGGNPVFKNSDLNIFHQQAQQNFNCIETSSAGRVLDAAAILLGFGDKNHYEGYLAEQLESNSNSLPFTKGDTEGLFENQIFLDPIIEKEGDRYILKTTELFQFLVENLERIPRERLAAFVQYYLSTGLWEIVCRGKKSLAQSEIPVVFSGGCAYNDIMTKYFLDKGVKINKKIPAGDGGISAGQIAYQLAMSD